MPNNFPPHIRPFGAFPAANSKELGTGADQKGPRTQNHEKWKSLTKSNGVASLSSEKNCLWVVFPSEWFLDCRLPSYSMLSSGKSKGDARQWRLIKKERKLTRASRQSREEHELRA